MKETSTYLSSFSIRGEQKTLGDVRFQAFEHALNFAGTESRSNYFVESDTLSVKFSGFDLLYLGAANNRTTFRSSFVTHSSTVANSFASAHPDDFECKIIDSSTVLFFRFHFQI